MGASLPNEHSGCEGYADQLGRDVERWKARSKAAEVALVDVRAEADSLQAALAAAEAALAAERERSGALAEAVRAYFASAPDGYRLLRAALAAYENPAPVATEATQEEDGRDR
jgi:hypothetical protein